MRKHSLEKFSWLSKCPHDLSQVESKIYQQNDANWHGEVEQLAFDRGIHMYVAKARIHNEFEIRVELAERAPFLTFIANLGAPHDYRLRGSEWRTFQTDEIIACHGLEAHQSIDYHHRAGTDLNIVAYSFSLDLVRSLLGDAVPEQWLEAFDGKSGDSYLETLKSSARLKELLRQMAGCPHSKPVRSIELEGLALQAFAEHAQSFQSAEPSQLDKEGADPKILQARALLLRDLREPPTLVELAMQVGISARKLSQGFKDIYGKGPFSILKDYRLEQARVALQEDAVNLKQIAWQVGYSHTSNFSAAYKEHFGVAPSYDN